MRDAQELARELLEGGVTDAVLLGMGGSSLASIVFARAFGGLARGGVDLHVLDTTCPESVQRVLDETAPARTVVLVASKSGGTRRAQLPLRDLPRALRRGPGHRERGQHVRRAHGPRLESRAARGRGRASARSSTRPPTSADATRR